MGKILLILLCLIIQNAHAEQGYASWYSQESCTREGTRGITASGEPLNDALFTCASWDYLFGTILKVTHNGKSVYVRVNDRGPNKKLYNTGRIIDLSVAAFRELAPLKEGVIFVEVEQW